MNANQRHQGICKQCHKDRLLWADDLCSQHCRNEWKKTITYSICRNCGKHLPKPKRGPMREYCDRGCKTEYQRKQRMLARSRTTRGLSAGTTIINDLEHRRTNIRQRQHDEDTERAAFENAAEMNERTTALL